MPRFVFLEHRWNGVHYDFMLEIEGRLRTWSVAEPIVPGEEFTAKALPDHRLAYLDYQGAISGGRGEVRRLDRGSYEIESWDSRRIVVDLRGDQLNGKLLLCRAESGDADRELWSLRFGNRD